MLLCVGFGFTATFSWADDPWAISRLGATNSELIWSGYVFIDGHYIDAPYQIQQYGYGMFVNGTFVDEAVLKKAVFPPQPQAAVTNDPGWPTNIVSTNTFVDIMDNAITRMKFLYFRDMNIRGPSLLEATTNYFAHFSCLTQLTIRATDTNSWDLIYLDHSTSQVVVLGIPFSDWDSAPAPSSPPDSVLVTDAVLRCRSIQNNLKHGACIWANGRTIVEYGRAPSSNLIQTLRLTNVSTKLAQLLSLGELAAAVGDTNNVELSLGHILTGFTASTQLEQRIAGDMTWTNFVPLSVQQPSP